MALLDNVVKCLTHSKAIIRKKAIVVLYKLYCQFPSALADTFDRLKDRLGDDDPAVVAVTVSVIGELSRSRASNYLPLVRVFFEMMSRSTNNWLLIKVYTDSSESINRLL